MKRATWILLILLVIVFGAYFLLKYRADKIAVEIIDTPISTAFLVQETGGSLIKIRIFDKDYQIVELQRNQEGFWEISLPTTSPADQSLASQAETQLNSLKIVSEIGEIGSLEDFGLTFPAYTIKLTYSNEMKYKIEIGKASPTGSGYYVQVDDDKVFIVSQYTLDTILNLISYPPFPATATPEPTLDLPTGTSTMELPSLTPEGVQPTP